MIIKQMNLWMDFLADGLDGDKTHLCDETYACPTVSSIIEIWESFIADLKVRGLPYTRRHDCDDFARAFAQYFCDAHALTPEDPAIPETSASAPAVFEIWYTQDSGDGHAINQIRSKEKGFVFFEPQNGKFLDLSKKEKDSRAFCR